MFRHMAFVHTVPSPWTALPCSDCLKNSLLKWCSLLMLNGGWGLWDTSRAEIIYLTFVCTFAPSTFLSAENVSNKCVGKIPPCWD